MRFHIEDWAGNICFGGITFKSFEDAWDYVMEREPDEEALQEYYVERAK